MKPIWKGSISFGLVNIPIKLYSSIKSRGAKMRLLHKEKLSPIRYKKTCDDCEGEVGWDEIVKGVEVDKNEFVVFSPEEIEAIRPGRLQTIEIVEFVTADQLDPIYIDSHYFTGPQKTRDKTYFLFKEVLQQTAKVGIGRFVMKEKEYTCAIRPYKEGILLTTLNYVYELREINQIAELQEKPELAKNEIELAMQLIERLTVKELNMNKYNDTFEENLQKLIEKKSKGEKITAKPAEAKSTKEEDLVEVLKASLK